MFGSHAIEDDQPAIRPPHLSAELDIAAVIAVAFVDMAQRSQVKRAKHNRGAQDAFDGAGFPRLKCGIGIGRSRQRPYLWRRGPAAYEERTNGSSLLMILEIIGQLREAIARDNRVIMQEQDVRAIGGPNPDVQRFREPEIFRQPDEADRGKLLIKGRCAVC